MKKRKITFSIFIIVNISYLTFTHFLFSQIKNKGVYFSPSYVSNEILVKFKPNLLLNQVNITIASYDSEIIEEIPQINVYRLKIPSKYSLEEMISAFNKNPDVMYAEPNYFLYLASIPNDPYFHYQYALRNTGQEIAPPEFNFPRGTPGADIKAIKAWDIETGNKTIVVGIVDTGVDIDHPDLKNNILSSGRDFANDDYNAMDDHGHGTHVAGIIAAETNNNTGVSGVCWECKILPVKVFDRNAKGQTAWVANGIIWAADQGVRVINLSLGGPDVIPNITLENAIKYAYEKNIILIAAAGNDGTKGVWHPAAYDNYVLAVSATDHNDHLVTLQSTGELWGSNFGPEVDVAAPGINILSTWPVNLWRRGHPGWKGYNYIFGTSMSTAFVSGMAALIVSHAPWLKNWRVMNIIRYSAEDVNNASYPGKDIFLGYGRINLNKASALIDLIDNRIIYRRPKFPKKLN